MLRIKSILSVLLISLVFMTSCGQGEVIDAPAKATVEAVEAAVPDYSKQHPYGGWYCPDNLRGFPPIDIQDLDQIEVVADRLPTKEETRNGISLMYFDKAGIPDAKPLEMDLPRVARIHSSHNGMKELIIVIQAVVAGKDTVVGFRYPNGGNGTSWYGQVAFLSDDEVTEIGSMPYVSLERDISASKDKVWRAFTATTFAKALGEKFDEAAFFQSDWSDDAQVHLDFESDGVKATGMVSSMWGLVYLHIDYDYNGFFFSEKMMLMENEDGSTKLHLVMGPYPDDFLVKDMAWKTWMEEVKESSERL